MPGLPGVTTTSAVRGQRERQRVLAPAGADDARTRHGEGRVHAAANDTNCSRPGADPDQADRHPDLLGQERHVVAGRLGHVGERGHRR